MGEGGQGRMTGFVLYLLLFLASAFDDIPRAPSRLRDSPSSAQPGAQPPPSAQPADRVRAATSRRPLRGRDPALVRPDAAPRRAPLLPGLPVPQVHGPLLPR